MCKECMKWDNGVGIILGKKIIIEGIEICKEGRYFREMNLIWVDIRYLVEYFLKKKYNMERIILEKCMKIEVVLVRILDLWYLFFWFVVLEWRYDDCRYRFWFV